MNSLAACALIEALRAAHRWLRHSFLCFYLLVAGEWSNRLWSSVCMLAVVSPPALLTLAFLFAYGTAGSSAAS